MAAMTQPSSWDMTTPSRCCLFCVSCLISPMTPTQQTTPSGLATLKNGGPSGITLVGLDSLGLIYS